MGNAAERTDRIAPGTTASLGADGPARIRIIQPRGGVIWPVIAVVIAAGIIGLKLTLGGESSGACATAAVGV